MFSKIIDTFRTNNSMAGRTGGTSNVNVERRSSTDEGDGNSDKSNNNTPTNHSFKSRTTGSIPITFEPIAKDNRQNMGVIGIRNSDTTDSDTLTADTVVYPDGRRRSSLFGYSTNAADDYMQKDLLSSSWS